MLRTLKAIKENFEEFNIFLDEFRLLSLPFALFHTVYSCKEFCSANCDKFSPTSASANIFPYVNTNETCEFGSRLMCTLWNASCTNCSKDFFLRAYISLKSMGVRFHFTLFHFILLQCPFDFLFFLLTFLKMDMMAPTKHKIANGGNQGRLGILFSITIIAHYQGLSRLWDVE